MRNIRENFIKKAMALFVERSTNRHQGKYDYSMVDYKGSGPKIAIGCPIHGIFWQRPSGHLVGKGCERCARELPHYNQMSTKEFISKATKLYGDKYDYSKVVYVKSCRKIAIGCRVHGFFEQTPNNHLAGYECIRCTNEASGISRRSTVAEFAQKARKVHGDKYDYSKVDYVGANTKINIVCPLHGLFSQMPSAHLSSRGCPVCRESRGERAVALFLKNRGIFYERQKVFDKCRHKRTVRFDFYVPGRNTCIEYDGRQHFFPSEYFGGIDAFNYLKKIDAIKDSFCARSGIGLVRIAYNWKSSKVDAVLEKAMISSNNLSLDNHIKPCYI